MNNRHIKNIIFDLGGVILDLSVDHTLQAFVKLSGLEKSNVHQVFSSAPFFELYEKGELQDEEFRQSVRDAYSCKATDDEIDTCWNAMLLGIPMIKLELLQRLMKSYHVILLSNTNTIHLKQINEIILPKLANVTSLDPYFHKTYYSHLLRMRKPDAEIFEWVLKENNLVPDETLFLDDNKMNVESAKALDIQIVHVTNPDLVLEYFHA